jgi:prophage regulatory protein
MMNRDRMQNKPGEKLPHGSRTEATMAFLEEIRGKRRRMPASPSLPTAAVAQPIGQTDVRVIRIKEVLAICGKSRSSVYELIQRGAFPAPVKLGGRSSGWVKAEVLAWVENCIRTRQDR